MDSSRNSVESRSDLTVGSVRIGNGEFCLKDILEKYYQQNMSQKGFAF